MPPSPPWTPLYKDDIDWRKGRIHVQRAYSDKANVIGPCKNNKDRWVTASPHLLAVLRSHVEALDLEGQLRGWSAEQRRVVFPTVGGRMVRHAHFIESVWQPLLSKAEVPYRKYHATRHTYATWMLETGADFRWVSKQMVHASLKQTADTYGHLIVDRHKATTGAIDRFLGVPARDEAGSPAARQSATPAQLMRLDTANPAIR